jgi:hypothetical protein
VVALKTLIEMLPKCETFEIFATEHGIRYEQDYRGIYLSPTDCINILLMALSRVPEPRVKQLNLHEAPEITSASVGFHVDPSRLYMPVLLGERFRRAFSGCERLTLSLTEMVPTPLTPALLSAAAGLRALRINARWADNDGEVFRQILTPLFIGDNHCGLKSLAIEESPLSERALNPVFARYSDTLCALQIGWDRVDYEDGVKGFLRAIKAELPNLNKLHLQFLEEPAEHPSRRYVCFDGIRTTAGMDPIPGLSFNIRRRLPPYGDGQNDVFVVEYKGHHMVDVLDKLVASVGIINWNG